MHKDKRSLHPEISARFSCNECDKPFYDRVSRKHHIMTYHSIGGTCNVCSKVFHSNLYIRLIEA